MMKLVGQLGSSGRHSRRVAAGRMALGGGSFFTVAIILLLASLTPFTFLPFMTLAVILVILGALSVLFPPLMMFLW